MEPIIESFQRDCFQSILNILFSLVNSLFNFSNGVAMGSQAGILQDSANDHDLLGRNIKWNHLGQGNILLILRANFSGVPYKFSPCFPISRSPFLLELWMSRVLCFLFSFPFVSDLFSCLLISFLKG